MNAEDIAVEKKKVSSLNCWRTKDRDKCCHNSKDAFSSGSISLQKFFPPGFFWSLLKDTAKLELKISLGYSYFRMRTSIPLIIQGVISKNFRR